MSSRRYILAKAREGEPEMNEKEFEKLVASVKQAGKIRRGKMKDARVFDLKACSNQRIKAKRQC
jgi:hypothetical protein